LKDDTETTEPFETDVTSEPLQQDTDEENGSEVGLNVPKPADSEESAGPTGVDKVLVEQYGYSWVDGKAVASTD
jgi:hypothetical protein